MIGADYLFLLTDVDCLYTDNPRRFPETAKQVRIVRDIETLRSIVSTSTMGSNLGTGGMETKIIAAELAIAAGVSTIITHGKKPQNILQILNNSFNLNISDEEYENNTPLHTVFLPEEEPLTDKKWWVLHGLKPRGRIVIDEGAYRAIARSTVNASSNSSSTTPQATTPPLASSSSTSTSLPSTPLSQSTTSTTTTTQQSESAVPSPSLLASSSARPLSIPRTSSTSNNRSSSGNGGRLLPAGVIAVEGTFAAGQAVTIVVQRKGRRTHSDLYTSSSNISTSANMNRGRRGSQNNASRSGSSSLANSLILEQAKQIGDPYDTSEEQYHQSRSNSPSLKEISMSNKGNERRARRKQNEAKIISTSMSDTDHGNDTTTDDDDSNEIEEQIEFGRGLANYNYDEIDRIKGHKR